MLIVSKVRFYSAHPYERRIRILHLMAPVIPDRLFLKLKYRICLGRPLHLAAPVTFTEKLQWLKLYDRKPDYVTMVDKVAAKEWASSVIGKEHIIKTFQVCSCFDDIDFDSLPDRFVIKTNHSGGSTGVVVCTGKSSLDMADSKRRIDRSLNSSTFLYSREWPYKNVKRQILCEEYLSDESEDLRDYKFYCFNGVPKVLLVASNRSTTHNFNYFDMDFCPLQIESRYGAPSSDIITPPDGWDEMVRLVRKLSAGIPHVRVDMYDVNGKVYFGEMTFYDSSGFDDMNSDEWNTRFGDWITLPDRNESIKKYN